MPRRAAHRRAGAHAFAPPLTTAFAAPLSSTFATATLTTAAAATVFRRGVAQPLFAHRRLARQLDAPLVVNQDDLDAHFVADVDDVGDAVDVVVRQLAYVAQAVGLGCDLDERAEFLDRDDLPGVDAADFDLGGHGLDDVAAFLCGGAVDAGDEDGAVVLDIDLAAGLFLDTLDVLPAGADQLADLFGVDLDGEEARGVLGDFGARGGQDGGHFF